MIRRNPGMVNFGPGKVPPKILLFLGRFALIFLCNTLVAYLWYLYEERPDLLGEVPWTILVLFIFGNIVFSTLMSVKEIYGKIGRLVDLSVDRLFGRTRVARSGEEESRVRLVRVRHFKMQRRYDAALKEVNEVIREAPEFAEALFLKATILGEGFGNTGAARGILEKVMVLAKKGGEEELVRWSRRLIDEMIRADGASKPVGTGCEEKKGGAGK